jgi:hypothetical protein
MARARGEETGHDVVTDAGTLVLFDPAHFEKIASFEAFEKELVEEDDIVGHIGKGHLVPLHTGADGSYRVEVRVGGALSAAEEKKVTGRSPAYLLVARGPVFCGGLEYVHRQPDRKSVGLVKVAAGRWSVTVCRLEGGKKMPDYVALASPAAGAKKFARALDPFAEADAAAANRARKETSAREKGPPSSFKNVKQALAAAVSGSIDAVIPALEAFAAKGAGSAWAALAQIRGYRGDWNGVLEAAAHLLADPNDVYAGNVTSDATWLLLRAAHETGRWEVADAAIKNQKPLRAGFSDPIGDHIRKQAKAHGKLADPPFGLPDDDLAPTEAERKAQYEEALAGFDADKKKRDRPGAREKAMYNYARAYGLPAIAMQMWPKVESDRLWDDAVVAARLFIKAGHADQASQILARMIRRFWPVDRAQVAPVEPLVDEVLRPLMTPERLATLLASPKAQES